MRMTLDDAPKSYTLDDEGNVARFVDTFEAELMFVSQYKRWFYWTGSHWAESIGQETEAARSMIQSMHTEARTLLAMGDTEGYKRLTAHISKSAGKIPYLVGLASKDPIMRASVDWLDSQRGFLNCRNAVVDLRNGDTMAPNPKDRLTRRTGALCIPGAEAPRWEAFLAQVLPDAEVRAYVQRLVGYSLLGDANERLIIFLYGIGRNGKSVFVETVREILGDYAVGTPVTTFLKKPNASGPSNDLARLRGARFIAASEFEEGAKVNTALLKQVTGDEKITARPMYGEYFDFPFEGTIWVSTNHMPFVGVQQAVWDRIKTIPFTVRIPDYEVDVRIKEKLLAEAPGILQWALEGCRQYMAHGLTEPASISQGAMEQRSDQDLLAPFVEDVCDVDASYTVHSADLYKAYQWWAVQHGENVLSSRTLGLRLKDAGYMPARTPSARLWRGLRIKATVEAPR
jgi:putative DNA primase/helicase